MKIEISRSTLALPDLLTPTSYWIGHLPFAFWLMEHFKPRSFVELGVHTGASYCAFCQAVDSLNLSTKCYGIDSFVGDAHYGEYSSEVLETLLSYHQPRYTAFSTIIQAEFSKALEDFEHGSIDLLHIDGTHFYEDAKQDFHAWLPKMSPNGIVLLHDTNVHSMDFGVHKLWAELLGKYRGFEFFHCNGLGVLFLGDEYPDPIQQLIDAPEEEKNTIRELFYALGSRCQEKAISEVAQLEAKQLREQLWQIDELRKGKEDTDKYCGELESSKRKLEKLCENRGNALNVLLSLTTEMQAGAAVSAAIHGHADGPHEAAANREQFSYWRNAHGGTIGSPDFPLHLARSSWKAAWFVLQHIRRHHILKPLAKREFVNQVKGIAETADNLWHQDPVAATKRYLEACHAVLDHLAAQRRTWWKRFFIHRRWLAAIRHSTLNAENHAALGADPAGGAAKDKTSTPLSRLETKYPGISVPRAITNARSLKARMRIPKTRWNGDVTDRPRMNFLFPDIDPDIVFGGYIAALEFAAAMSARYDIRIITTAYPMGDTKVLMEKFAKNPRIHGMLAAAGFAELNDADDVLPVGPGDFFCSYSFWDGLLAHNLALATGQRRFISFCQEDESSFHAHDYCHATARYSQSLPQFAVFNTTILQDYFRKNSLGVYHKGADGDARSVAFQHALVPTKPASADDYAGRKIRRILVYARPEDHAKRNLFEFALLALERFLKEQQIARDEVEIVGVGTLEFQSQLQLGGGHVLKVQPKLELGDYATSLATFDVGLSLMYAPHPSILPFEMAAAGLVVVTNTFGTRDEHTLTGISGNIVPAETSIEGIASALATAWQRCSDHPARIRNAEFDWSRDWGESFSTAIVDRLDSVVREILSDREPSRN